ncbi:MAG: hypothetical protein OXG35_01635 [Acidobacteria bacterium]|nr:hypothetical protein [Acidobacteriota bacterium]
MRRTVLAAVLLALTVPASAQVIRADYQHTQSKFGGEPILVEAGSHFVAADGRYRHDRLEVASGELVSEIRLPRTRERIVMRRQAQAPVGWLTRAWNFANALANVLRYGLPSHDYDTAVERRENLGERLIGDLTVRGLRAVVDYETGWRSTREIWLTSHDALWPFALESSFVTTDEDGRLIGVEELRVTSTERIPLDEALFEASGDREVFGFVPPGSLLASAGR